MKWKLIVFAAIISTSVFAEVKVQPIFGDNMVLQQNTSVNIWGTAKPGEKVNVNASWKKSAETKAAEDGKWQVKLQTPKAGGPYTLSIKGKNTLKFKNIMIGEVWLCTGQSNMDCAMRKFKDTKEAISKANYPNIRFFDVRKKFAPEGPVEELGGKWKSCTPATTTNFSATGYFFGLKLYQELKVPIGLIECAFGGTIIEAWTPWEKQKDNPRIAKYKKGMAKKLKDPNYPSTLYNGMTYPLAPYTVKGAIWYQGESNAWKAHEYENQLKIMIGAWRERWGQGDFPFYCVQLPGFQKAWRDPVEEYASWALMREAFANIANKVPNTAMAITIDIGEANNIHPQQKSKVGDRLALIALKKDYGKDIPWSGPIMKSCEFKDGKAIIKFNTGGSPLTAKDSKIVKGFAFRNQQGKFIRARAHVTGDDTVEVFSETVKNPSMVYYGWAMNPEGINLFNKAGLPASPFRYGKKSPAAPASKAAPSKTPKKKVNLMQKVIPESIAKKYELVYEIDPKSAVWKGGKEFVYVKNNSDKVKGPFSKVAYFLGLQDDNGDVKYVFVEMDPFTDDIKKIGVPDKASGARFQQALQNVRVKSNVDGVKNGKFPDGCNIEFWHCNYIGNNAKNIPGANATYDFGDTMTNPLTPGYGSMQIHNNKEKHTIFSFSNLRGGSNADVGIGNAKGGQPDWTFSKSAQNYPIAELKVFIKK